MTARESSRAPYRAVVAPSRTEPWMLEYHISRAVLAREMIPASLRHAVPEDYIAHQPLGELTTPECTRTQAYHMALAWLRMTEAEPVPDDAIELEWHHVPIQPVREASGRGGRYAPNGRRRGFLRR